MDLRNRVSAFVSGAAVYGFAAKRPGWALPSAWLALLALSGSLWAFKDPITGANVAPPADGKGAKWSTITEKNVDGQQVRWAPYPQGYRFVGTDGNNYLYIPVFYGYEVTLADGNTKINVWYLAGNRPDKMPQADWDNVKRWCHGQTFDDDTLSVGGESVNTIITQTPLKRKLKACLTQTQQSNLAAGDIIVYSTYNGFKNPPAPPAPQFKIPQYVIGHSAISNGDGTFTSKDRYFPLDTKATFASMEAVYANLAPKGQGPNGGNWADFGRFCYGPQ